MTVVELRHAWASFSKAPLIVRVALRALDLFARPIAAFGVEYPRFRAIVELKLLLDGRREREAGGSRLMTAGLAVAMGFYAVFGAMLGFAAFGIHDPFLWTLLVETIAAFLIGMHLLMGFGTLVVDTTDVQVIASRPVRDRTVFAAVVTHALLYAGLLSASFGLGPTLLGAIAYASPHVLWAFPLAHALATATTVGLVGLLYAIVLRCFGPVQFQRASFWMQIVVLCLWMGGSQIAPRLGITRRAAESLDSSSLWFAALPPAHSGGLLEVALGHVTTRNAVLAGCALALPALLGALALALASRHFVAALAGQGAAPPRVARGTWRPSPFARLGALLTRSRAERAGYDFALQLSRRDRIFLRGVFPGMAMMMFMGVGAALPIGGASGASRAFGGTAFLQLLLLSIAPSVLIMAQYCEHAPARWIFDAMPIARRAQVHGGAILALLAGTWLPVVVVTLTLIASFGRVAIADVGLSFELLVLGALLLGTFLPLRLSFTEKVRGGSRAGDGCVSSLIGMALAAALAALHWALSMHPVAQIAGMLAIAPIVIVLFLRLSRHAPAAGREIPES